MRIDPDGTIVLSRRNVLALLHKLDFPGSQRTIVKVVKHPDGVQKILSLKAEDDDVHYRDEAPGEMHPATEKFISKSTEKRKRTLNDALGGLKL